MEFRSFHTLTTADDVPVKVELAGLAGRVFAFGIDFIAMLTLSGCLLLLFLLPSGFSQWPEIKKTIIPLGLFLIFFGYHLFQEWLWNGQTLGKMFLGIRVVRQNGQPIGFWESLGRNLLRVVDVYASGIGLVCMMLNRREQRFGDLLAGTLVIQNQSVQREAPVSGRVDKHAGLFDPVAAKRLQAEEAELIRSFLNRRNKLLKSQRSALADELCQYLSKRLHYPMSTEADLENLLAQYQ